MKTLISTLIIASFLVLLPAFKPAKEPITSLKEMKKVMKDGYSFVPSGNMLLDGDTVSCQGFFMMKTEVSNFDYKEYLYYLKNTKKDMAAYNDALPDTTLWSKRITNAEAMSTHYFSHPAYRNFPVVNISKKQAEGYCNWLSEVWQKNTGNTSIRFRLPLRAEFIMAANGGEISRPYAWKGPYLRDDKGMYLANFMHIGEGAISRDKDGKLVITNQGYYSNKGDNSTDLMVSSKSYCPNEYGIYNLNGNVSEMVAEKNMVVGGDWNSPGFDIRNESHKEITGADPTVGFRPVMTFAEKIYR